MNWSAELSLYLVLIGAGFLPNEVWRMLGIVVAHGLDEGSELVIWVRAVATGLLAGVVAKIILFPPGGLADVSLTVRLSAIAIGFVVFLLVRRSVFAGVLAGEAVLILGAFWLAG
jgi:branched-subunit amino acid transport protein